MKSILKPILMLALCASLFTQTLLAADTEGQPKSGDMTQTLLYRICYNAYNAVSSGIWLNNQAQDSIGISNYPLATITLTITNHTGTNLAAGDALAQGIELTGFMTTNKTAMLISAELITASSLATEDVSVILSKAPFTTWPTNSGAINLSDTDRSNIVAGITFNSSKAILIGLGTNNQFSIGGINQVVKGAGAASDTGTNTSIWAYFRCGTAVTNSGNSYLKIGWQKEF